MAGGVEIGLTSLVVAFVFALGGLGSAAVLVPVLVFLGVPFPLARPAGLFANFLSTLSASVHNLRKGLVDFRLAVPLIVTSLVTSPAGAYASHLVSERIVGVVFTLFLFFAGIMVYVPKREMFGEGSSPLYPLFVGAVSGFLSGFLGIGGGGIISPLLIVAGYDPKKVVAVTPFAVIFSSLSGFLAYWRLGSVDWSVTLWASVPALFAGYLGAYVSHRYLSSSQIKRLLGVIFFLLGIKFLTKFL